MCACVPACDFFSPSSQIWQGMKCLLENYANTFKENTKRREIETWKKSNTKKKRKGGLSEQMASKHGFKHAQAVLKNDSSH